jgi:hypothetical protein
VKLEGVGLDIRSMAALPASGQHRRMERPDTHDAATVTLAAAWVGVCASCSWIGPERDSEQRAAADVKWHKLSTVEAETIS